MGEAVEEGLLLRRKQAPAEAGKATGMCWARGSGGKGIQTQRFRSEDLHAVFREPHHLVLLETGVGAGEL